MFDVASLPGHRLEAEAQQLTYRKNYAGSGLFGWLIGLIKKLFAKPPG